jgi:ribosomal RNA-processing protein 8
MADFAALFERKRAAPSMPAPKQTDARQRPPPSSAPPSKKQKKKKQAQAQAQGQGQAHVQAHVQAQTHAHAHAPERGPTSATLPAASAPGSSKLRRRMEAQLSGAHFRYINELLYTQPSKDAVALFKADPRMYDAYHEGFRSQAARWPAQPVRVIADWLRTLPVSRVVADLGCGDAELAKSVPQRVHSFDLVAVDERVIACDIADVPLADRTVDVAVFCLALMGSNFAEFLREAHRILRPRGLLKIAEVRSRIDDTDGWDALLFALGFDLVDNDDDNTHFVLYEYEKSARKPLRELPAAELKPCVYKKR